MASRWMLSRTFVREFASGAGHAHGENAAETAAMWKKLFFIVAIPAIGLGMLNVYLHETQEEHVRPPFVPYEHLRIRTKRYPWGDGQRTLFHNPHVNPLPSGYEDEH